METVIRLLIVDDEEDFVQGLRRLILTDLPEFEVFIATCGEEALKLIKSHEINLVCTDLQMPGMDGLSLTKAILTNYPGMKVIILTGYGTIEKAVESVQLGAYDFLTKPVSAEQLQRTLVKVAETIRLQAENEALRKLLVKERSDTMLGQSPAMMGVKQAIQAVAMSDYPVLVFGESGTGKELAARMIHGLSSRKEKPFVAINCPAIPDSLLESELFGYRKGAFTGADRDREGLFLSAKNGTLHLDEIGDISPAMQTKLLRFLQDGEIRAVGATKTEKTDVRIIASTNQNLEEKVSGNLFRADLFYRLNVVTIRIPPLRERLEDVALLARFFLEQAFYEMGGMKAEIEPDVLSYLATKEWPGNVRELQNFVRRLVVFRGEDDISMVTVQQIENSGDKNLVIDTGLGPYKTMKNIVTDRFSRDYFEQLFRQTGGNVSEAARISGLTRVAVQKLCQRLQLNPGKFR